MGRRARCGMIGVSGISMLVVMLVGLDCASRGGATMLPRVEHKRTGAPAVKWPRWSDSASELSKRRLEVAKGLQRIVNGKTADPGEYSWFTQLFILYADGNEQYTCGGTLVGSRWILTAAHCFLEDIFVPYAVVGLYDSVDFTTGFEARAVNVYIHPNWDASTFEWDAALIELSEDVRISTYARLFGLDSSTTGVDLVGERSTIIGFGDLFFGGEGSSILLEEDLFVEPDSVCRNLYDSSFTATSMLCAGYEPEPPADTCQGDSGGPLVLGDDTGESSQDRLQIGIVSFGAGCAHPDFPAAVYTRISAMTAWLGCVMQRPGFENCAGDYQPTLQIQNDEDEDEDGDGDGNGDGNGNEDGFSTCFPANGLVEMEDGLFKRMDALKLGDMVRVSSDTFSPVVFWGHHDAKSVHGDFVRIQLEHHILTVTSGHLVYANGKLVVAGIVQPGDIMTTGTGENVSVLSVRRNVRAKGLYNPHTEHGDIVVDGVKASCYTRWVAPGLGHALHIIERFSRKLFGLSLLDNLLDANALIFPHHRRGATSRNRLGLFFGGNDQTTDKAPGLECKAAKKGATDVWLRVLADAMFLSLWGVSRFSVNRLTDLNRQLIHGINLLPC
ncbi:Transmembrane protease serine 9 [Porphyridium purpureum]|uniref:Transmembrane protease serine 9 n=1 Tax=Porphyridium purpureum TaxID=35688 RepID=A0A5J4YUK4_PORPP|nr:Transmembrane protease serine 9 [Porphyridium purpureum]|eukprot:POR5465..scf227_4